MNDPAPNLCSDCQHEWDDHILEGYSEPMNGGNYHCPVEGCGCTGTWSVSMTRPFIRRERHDQDSILERHD